MNDLVIMERQNIVDIADAIRNKTGVNDAMTLVDMVTSINEIEMGSEELPSAEDAVFGATEVKTEYGFTETVALVSSLPAANSFGIRFTAAESFQITALRVYTQNFGTTPVQICIWDENGEKVRSATITTSSGTRWYEAMLSEPLTVLSGETYTFGRDSGATVSSCRADQMVFNGKLLNVAFLYKSGGGFPTEERAVDFSTYVPEINIVMEPIAQILPDTYKIERTTMDDIAEEVQRITGTETKMSVAQMQSGLESVVLQEKSVTPTAETQTITPDSNYYGLSKVTVNPARLQEKSVIPTTEQQEIVPDDGYYGLSKVTVEAAATSEELPSAEKGAF